MQAFAESAMDQFAAVLQLAGCKFRKPNYLK
jgi:hypothetical protein